VKRSWWWNEPCAALQHSGNQAVSSAVLWVAVMALLVGDDGMSIYSPSFVTVWMERASICCFVLSNVSYVPGTASANGLLGVDGGVKRLTIGTQAAPISISVAFVSLVYPCKP
jgi:hypothetical protein